jgi:hypothetical protein
MANLEVHGPDLRSIKRAARHSAHVHRAQTMLAAAGLAAMGVVLVAATLLTQIA